MLVRVLGREHHERRRERASRAVHRHLALGHRLEQAALRPRRGPVDLVRQHQVCEERAGLEHEAVAGLVVNGDAGDVAREQVARELDAREREIERSRQRLRQRGLADARHVLEQQVPSGGESRERQLDDLLFSLQGARDVRFQRRGDATCLWWRERRSGRQIDKSDLRGRGAVVGRHPQQINRCSGRAACARLRTLPCFRPQSR